MEKIEREKEKKITLTFKSLKKKENYRKQL